MSSAAQRLAKAAEGTGGMQKSILRRGVVVTAGAVTGASQNLGDGAERASEASSSSFGGIGHVPAPAQPSSPRVSAADRLKQAAAGADVPAASAPKSEVANQQVRDQQSPAAQRLSSVASADVAAADGRRHLNGAKALSRLMEAIAHRPGFAADEQSRVNALQSLAMQAHATADRLQEALGLGSSSYVHAQAMEAVVGLVGGSWEKGESIDWGRVLAEAGADPEIYRSALALAEAGYRPVDSVQTAAERMGISLLNAYWELYALGEKVDGMTLDRASMVVSRVRQFLQDHPRRFESNDLHVAWMQGAVKRIVGLVSAELSARYANLEPSDDQVKDAVELALSCFQGVEDHVEALLDLRPRPEPAPADR